MKNEKIKNRENEDSSELLEHLKSLVVINKGGAVVLFISVPIGFFLGRIFNIDIPTGLLITLSVFALTISTYIYLLTKKVHNLSDLENTCLGYFISNIFLYTLIIHYIGGIEGLGIIIYSFVIVEASIMLPRKKALFVILTAIICYSSLGFLEYFGIIPHHEFFLTGFHAYNNIRYLIFAIIMGAVFGFNYSGFITSNFSNVYKKISSSLIKERKELVKTQTQLKETRDTLEIRVEARTKELKELAQNLEQQVKERTKELQGKLQDLEKFQRFTVGRELKMSELKEKIKGLEKKEEG